MGVSRYRQCKDTIKLHYGNCRDKKPGHLSLCGTDFDCTVFITCLKSFPPDLSSRQEDANYYTLI